MDDLLKQISGTMAQYEMAAVGEKILAAVSGGADSVCMMLALKELGYSVHAVHVEHGIRGQESLEDLAFTQSVCRREQIGLTVRQIDAPLLAKKTGRSLEEAARDERARILLETAESLHIWVIATAHHMNDQAETVLWNLVRGSSVAGLCGILPVREVEAGASGRRQAEAPERDPAGASGRDPAGAPERDPAESSEREQAEASEREQAEGARKIRLIRPLIHCSRQQIEDWLEARGQAYRVDRTNLDPSITRNALRLQILPQLECLNSQAQRHIAQAASDFEQAERCLDKMTERVYAKAACRTPEGDVRILLEALEGEEDLIRQRVFHRALGEALGGLRDVTRQHVDALVDLSRMDNGRRITLPGGKMAVREEGAVVFRKSPGPDAEDVHFAEEIRIDHDGVYETPFGIRLTVRFGVFEGGNIEKKKYTKLLAYDTMTPYLTLRTRRAGDWLAVNASGGRKKLKEYLIEEKVPRDQRDQIPLIAQGSHVLWVVGGRISEGARVREGLHYAEITVQNLTESRDAADRGE